MRYLKTCSQINKQRPGGEIGPGRDTNGAESASVDTSASQAQGGPAVGNCPADVYLNNPPLAGAEGCEEPANSWREASRTALSLTRASPLSPLSPS